MWLLLAFLSAFLLGCYEVNKKMSLTGNAVIPVLFCNTLICSLIFLPFILLSFYTDTLDGTMFYVPRVSAETHLAVFIKAVIVLSSWISGYFALKHLPLTLTGPIKATQPVLTLLGALIIFGERLNFYQWVGVAFAVASFYLLSLSGKKEGINFAHNKWIALTVLSVAGAGRDDCAGVVQCLSVRHHAAHPAVPLVSKAERDDAVRLAVEYRLHLGIHLSGGLDILLCLELPRLDDIHHLDDTAQQCAGNLRRRRPVLP